MLLNLVFEFENLHDRFQSTCDRSHLWRVWLLLVAETTSTKNINTHIALVQDGLESIKI